MSWVILLLALLSRDQISGLGSDHRAQLVANDYRCHRYWSTVNHISLDVDGGDSVYLVQIEGWSSR